MASLLLPDMEVVESPPPIFMYSSSEPPSIYAPPTTKRMKSKHRFTATNRHKSTPKTKHKPILRHCDSTDSLPTDSVPTDSMPSDIEIKENLDIPTTGSVDVDSEQQIDYLVISDIEDMHSGYDSNDTMDSNNHQQHVLTTGDITTVDFIDEEPVLMHCTNSPQSQYSKRKKRDHRGMRYMVGIGAVCAIGMWIGYGATRSIAILSSVSGSKKK